MLKRVYIHNYKCFVNFELSLGPQQLIMGLNGSGKSTLLEALEAVKKLSISGERPEKLFSGASCTRWTASTRQTIELEVDLPWRPPPYTIRPIGSYNSGSLPYRFKLEIDSIGRHPATSIKREALYCEGKPLFEFEDGNVRLFDDTYSQDSAYFFDPFRSGLATIQERPDHTKLTCFKNWLQNIHCLRLNPLNMTGEAEGEDQVLARDMTNFAAWYRYMALERADSASALQAHLRQILPGLVSLDHALVGRDRRKLSARFDGPSDGQESYSLDFDELSDGQRALICLYALLEFAVGQGACLFLDEPENFLALSEIQPWLMELRDRLEDRGGQVILISHHPEMIDYLAPEIGLVFEREGQGPVRVRKYESDKDAQLSPSERIARGWQANA